MKKYDLIIIGTGPAGLSAAIYAARYKINCLLIGQIPGGIAGTAHDIRNYPGFEKVTGMELMKRTIDQVKKLEVPIVQDAVINLKKKGKEFEVETPNQKFLAKKLIISTGTERRKLGLENENEFVGRGISYCATCDAGFYKDKVAAVIGGGDAALTAALLLEKFAKKVYIIYRKNKFTKAEPAWVDDVNEKKKIEVLFNLEVTKIIGDEKIKAVKLNNGKEIKLDGIFIEVGATPNVKLAEELGLELENTQIIVDAHQRTNIPGVFAAGDVTNRPFKQIISGAGDGATACYTAYKELEKEKERKK